MWSLNQPAIWWAQGDAGTVASPGGWLRLFGKNLSIDGKRNATVLLRGPVSVRLSADSDGYSAKVALPNDLPVGEYYLLLHTGFGGSVAWSEAKIVMIEKPSAWPTTVINVKDLGADGTGAQDDTVAVQAALTKAQENGGGIVYFPRGRYRVADTLTVPRFTVLRGEKRELVNIFWPDTPNPPEALIRGTNSFGLEDLTLYASSHRHIIASDLGDVRDAGDVFLRRLRVRADTYRGHLKPEEVEERFRASLRWSTGGGDTVRLGGKNIEIADCDLYGSGRALFLSRVRGGWVHGNTFYNGRWGWYCISGSDGLIFESNEVIGGDLMSTGGGLNCLDGSAYSQNIYYAHNRLRLFHGWDREAMTTDAGGEAYMGKVAAVKGSVITLAGEPKWGKRDWRGAGVFILDGKGAGQYRRVVRYQGPTVAVGHTWDIEPDTNSDLCITMFQGHILLVDNDFTDTGAMQFYGTSIECIVAQNHGTRMQGFRGLGLWYHGYQPSWFCQFLDNRIHEGNYYHWSSAADSFVEVFGARHPPYGGPMNRGAIVRRNQLDNNAHIRVGGTCRDVVVEGNKVQNANMGIFVSKQCSNVFLRNNEFANVKEEVVDEEALRRAAEERLKKFIGRQEPVAVWDFDSMTGNKFADGSGNGFYASLSGGVKAVAGGVRGQAASFDGTGYLRVEETAVFNVPDVTLSLWIKPATLRGRRGLVAKRYAGTAAPFVLSQNGAMIGFEATEENGPWTFNFHSPTVLKEGEWTHVAAVVKRGEGVWLYVNGKAVAEKKNPASRATNAEPLIIGREAWGGDPPKGGTPGFYTGLMDEVKVWARALTPEEIKAEFEKVAKAK
jgi:hypothetical protein